jgi:hypothetical protein
MARYEVLARLQEGQSWTTVKATHDKSEAQAEFDRCKAQPALYDRAKIVMTQVVDSWELLRSMARRIGPPLTVAVRTFVVDE